MRTMRSLISAMVLSLIPCAIARACTCDTGNAIQEFKKSAAVFSGTVVGRRKHPSDDLVELTFYVERVWKGPRKAKIVVFAFPSDEDARAFRMGSTDCGPGLKLNGRYLVYAWGDEQGLGTLTACSRIREIGLAKEDFRAMGQGKRVNRR